MSDNYITLMPGEERTISVEAGTGNVEEESVFFKQYGKAEQRKLDI